MYAGPANTGDARRTRMPRARSIRLPYRHSIRQREVPRYARTMRLLVALVIAIFVTPAHAQTVWNVKVDASDGGSTQLRVIDGNPNTVLPLCRCVAGVWKMTDETATHFVGTLDSLSFNHKRKATKT